MLCEQLETKYVGFSIFSSEFDCATSNLLTNSASRVWAGKKSDV